MPPRHKWEDVREKAANNASRRMTMAALDGCNELNLDPEDIWEVLASAGSPHCVYRKKVESVLEPGETLDVYDGLVCGVNVYIKIKINAAGTLVVISSKRNTDYE